MRVEFSDHAELKIEQRKLSCEQILLTILQPDFIKHSYNRREKLFKKFGKNHLQVVIKRESVCIVVVTAHWIARMTKN
ncbi:DUF4258 domain-containing protein [Patescibacteria group bacterium]|nr:DUF4258 domain-containing protein [Patescibacteria group bacterium]